MLRVYVGWGLRFWEVFCQVCFVDDERGKWGTGRVESTAKSFLEQPAELFCLSISGLRLQADCETTHGEANPSFGKARQGNECLRCG